MMKPYLKHNLQLFCCVRIFSTINIKRSRGIQLKSTFRKLNKDLDQSFKKSNDLIDRLSKGQQNSNDLIDRLSKGQQNSNDLIDSLSKERQKTDLQLRQLIGYNSNRDNELERVMLKSFTHYLNNLGWIVFQVDIDKIYDTQGTEITEWDGMIYATHEDYSCSCMFLLETKQVFTLSKLHDFDRRLYMMKENVIPSLNYKDPNASQVYKSMAKSILKYFDLNKNKEIKVYGVIACPTIEKNVFTAINPLTSYVTLLNNSYEVVLAKLG